MRLPAPMVAGTLRRRYQRFLADVELADGSVVTAHTPNTGSMLQCAVAGHPVLISRASQPGTQAALDAGADPRQRPLGRYPHPPHQPRRRRGAARRNHRRAGRLQRRSRIPLRRQPSRFFSAQGGGENPPRSEERHPHRRRRGRLLPRCGHRARPAASARAAAGEEGRVAGGDLLSRPARRSDEPFARPTISIRTMARRCARWRRRGWR